MTFYFVLFVRISKEIYYIHHFNWVCICLFIYSFSVVSTFNFWYNSCMLCLCVFMGFVFGVRWLQNLTNVPLCWCQYCRFHLSKLKNILLVQFSHTYGKWKFIVSPLWEIYPSSVIIFFCARSDDIWKHRNWDPQEWDRYIPRKRAHKMYNILGLPWILEGRHNV